MELLTNISQNPLSLYRGSDISDKWYFEMKDTANELLNLLDLKKKNEEKIEIEKDKVISIIESEFAVTKETQLLNIKRDIHNLRVNKIKKYGLDENQTIDLSGLLKAIEEKETLASLLLLKYDESYLNSRKIIHREIRNESLRKTVIFFNRNIYKNIDKYLETDVENHNKKIKKLDNFIINILMRSSMKTSPFSYLTKTGAVNKEYDTKKVKNIEINHALIYRIFLEKTRTDSEALKKIPVVVSKFGVKGSKIFFVTQENVKQSKKIYETSDKLAELSLDSKVIDFLKSKQGEEIFYSQFNDFLQENNLYPENELKVFKKLVSIKILAQRIVVNSKRNLIGEMIEYLKLNNICEDLMSKFIEMNERLDEFVNCEFGNRLKHWEDIEGIIKELSVDIPSFGTEILYEDILFPTNTKDELQEAVKDKFSLRFFDTITDFLLLFDVNVRVQFEVANLFKNIYGDREVQLSDSKLLNEVFFEKLRYFFPYFQDMNYRYAEAIAPEVKILDDLRDEFKNYFDKCIDESTDSINLYEIIEKFTSRIPDYIKKNNEYSMTFFYQLSNNQVVLNDIYDGQEKFLSRFKDFFDNYNEDPKYQSYIEKNYTQKNYYEITELFGFNGGIHERRYKQKLNLNIGNQRFIDEENQSVEDFKVVYSEKYKKLLFLDKNEKVSRIAYKSSLVPIFLPGVLSVLLLMFQSGRINFDINYFLKRKKHINRIKFDDIIMYREKWNLNGCDIREILDNSKDDLELYIKFKDYFSENILPNKFFLKKYRGESEISGMKPMFVDIEVPLLLKYFITEIKEKMNEDTVFYIEEVLPEFENNLIEYMVEYTIDK